MHCCHGSSSEVQKQIMIDISHVKEGQLSQHWRTSWSQVEVLQPKQKEEEPTVPWGDRHRVH